MLSDKVPYCTDSAHIRKCSYDYTIQLQ